MIHACIRFEIALLKALDPSEMKADDGRRSVRVDTDEDKYISVSALVMELWPPSCV